ncbi:MAG: hypothetical protein ACKOBV_05820, partial [Candidatus Kapaibacterium sp.]
MPHQIFINVLFGVPEEQYDTAYAVFGAYDIQGIEEGHDQLTVCFRVEDWSEETGTQLLGQLADYGVQARIIDTERIEQ